jgi:hypothetical protein
VGIPLTGVGQETDPVRLNAVCDPHLATVDHKIISSWILVCNNINFQEGGELHSLVNLYGNMRTTWNDNYKHYNVMQFLSHTCTSLSLQCTTKYYHHTNFTFLWHSSSLYASHV